MLVVGLARRKGDYQGTPYDNMMIYALRPADESKGEQGQIAEVIKIKYENYSALIDVGVTIRPIYNRYGQVVDIEIK